MYIKIINTTTKYPYNLSDLYKENPLTSFPKFLTKELLKTFEVYKVESSDPPEFDPKVQYLKENTPVLENGTYKRNWSIENLDLETASNNVRSYRNRLLSDTDWTQTEDSPVNKELWKNYRQNLRDISSQSGFPYEVLWPTPPT